MKKNRRRLSVIEIRPVRVTKRGGLGSQSLYPAGEFCFRPDAYKKKPLRVLGAGASFSAPLIKALIQAQLLQQRKARES